MFPTVSRKDNRSKPKTIFVKERVERTLKRSRSTANGQAIDTDEQASISSHREKVTFNLEQ